METLLECMDISYHILQLMADRPNGILMEKLIFHINIHLFWTIVIIVKVIPAEAEIEAGHHEEIGFLEGKARLSGTGMSAKCKIAVCV